MHSVNVETSEFFQALSDPIRLRVIRLLVTSGEELCLCELSRSLDEPEYKLSRHLKILRGSGLLEAFKDGRWLYHRLVKGTDYFRYLLKMVKALPDTHGLFTEDLKRFGKQVALRKNGRCR